ncbi:MAG TPA: TMEM43 family protein [bacterium]|nr:TMEM43 family protein [bacterium]
MSKHREMKRRKARSEKIVGGTACFVMGLAMFSGSLYMIYWNESRKDVSVVAKTSVVIDAGNPAANRVENEKLVSATGQLTSGKTIGDGLYLKPDNYIATQRVVEMYAWKQVKREKKNSSDESSGKKTTYSYSKKWMREPDMSDRFKYAEGHHNPPKAIDDAETRAEDAKVGAYSFDMAVVELPSYKKLALSNENTTIKGGAALADSDYIFKGEGSLSSPEIGDLRIGYKIIESGRMATIMGKLDNDRVTSYDAGEYGKIFRIFDGTKESAVGALHKEFLLRLWGFRAGALALMWMGISLMIGPLTVSMNIMPADGAKGRVVIGFAAFIISLVLSAAAIIVSGGVHSLTALIPVLAGGIALVLLTFALFKIASSKRKATPA